MKVDILFGDSLHPQYWPIYKGARLFSGDFAVKDARFGVDWCHGGDFLFLVCCTQIVPKDIRDRYKHTLVLHESDLPKGRGWSPLAWQILEGKSEIVISMCEAEDKVDSGPIWLKGYVKFEGHETNEEIHEKVAKKKLEMIEDALGGVEPYPQEGEPFYYKRRTPEDSRVRLDSTVEGMFNLLRVADDRFPVFFEHLGHKYKLKMDKCS